MISADDYTSFLDREYLSSFVAGGGGAVKFAVAPDDGVAQRFSDELRLCADAAGFVAVRVDAAQTRVHMIDQLFFAIARQIDWDALARTTVRDAWAAIAHPVPDGSADLTVAAMAERHGVDPAELSRDVNRHLQLRIHRDYAMAQEFRIAMLRLCQAPLATGQVTGAEHTAVLEWLRGDLRQMSLLRSATIFRRIGRHNARYLLFSLAHWLSVNATSGLVLELDMRRLGVARRPHADERSGLYYTKAALMDAYELLRQLVDNTDELTHCCVAVICAPEFLADQARGVEAYQALKLRIIDDVRDLRRDNPYASLIRLGAE